MLTIKFQSSMYLYSPGNKKVVQIPLPKPKLLQKLLVTFGLTGCEIGFILINNKRIVSLDDIVVKAGDIVELYPFMGGG